METAQFRYYEYQQVGDLPVGERRRVNIGSFTEKIEIEDQDYMHERLDVPPILESRRSTVVHDFEKVKIYNFQIFVALVLMLNLNFVTIQLVNYIYYPNMPTFLSEYIFTFLSEYIFTSSFD